MSPGSDQTLPHRHASSGSEAALGGGLRSVTARTAATVIAVNPRPRSVSLHPPRSFALDASLEWRRHSWPKPRKRQCQTEHLPIGFASSEHQAEPTMRPNRLWKGRSPCADRWHAHRVKYGDWIALAVLRIAGGSRDARDRAAIVTKGRSRRDDTEILRALRPAAWSIAPRPKSRSKAGRNRLP